MKSWSHQARAPLAFLTLAALLLAPVSPALVPSLAPSATGADAVTWSNANAPGGGRVWGLGGGPQVLAISMMAGEGAYRSFDDGRSWERIEGFPAVDEANVAWDPSNPLRGYIHGFGGVARTNDGGLTWDLVIDTPASYVGTVAPNGRAAMSWRESNFQNHVSVSDDGGLTWTDWNVPLPQFSSLYGMAFLGSPDKLLVMSSGNTYVTHDAGASWTVISGGGLALGVEEDGDAWRSGFAGFLRSSDGGLTWSPVTAPANAQLLAPRPGGGMYMSAFDGLYLTLDDGATWTAMGQDQLSFGATTMIADPEDPDAVLLSSEFVGVARVAPDGQGGFAVELRTSGLPAVPVSAVAASADAQLVAAVSDNLGVFLSRDGGATWGHAGAGFGLARLPGLAVSADGQSLWVGGMSMIFSPVAFWSHDAGLTWEGANFPDSGGDGVVVGFALDPEDNDHAFAAFHMELASSKVYETTDGGATWAIVLDLPGSIRDIAWHAPTGGVLAVTDQGLLAYESLAPGLPPAWQPRSLANTATWVASDGGVAFTSGLVPRVWRTGVPGLSLFVPWTDAINGIADAAVDPVDASEFWARTGTGQLHRCGAVPPDLACENVTPPDGGVRGVALAGDGSRAWAASNQGGLWTALL